MRWFIEVSRVGEDAPLEKYCLEAKQWQAALQEARKLRGDTGPLSKFSIELLENGYRAVDPAQQVRYVVNKAPGETPLSQSPPAGDAAVPPGAFPAIPKAGPPPAITMGELEGPATDPMPPLKTDPMAAPLRTDPMAAGLQTDPLAAPAPPAEAHKGNSGASAHEAPGPASASLADTHPSPLVESSAARPRQLLLVPEDEVPKAPQPSSGQAPAPAPVAQAPRPASSEPAGPAPAAEGKPQTGQMTQRSMEVAREPDFQLVKKREEEPTDQTPLVYREYAYAVAPGTDRKAAEVLLWLRFREVCAGLRDRGHRKFVQLAVFDHVFEKKPARPPIATLAWKDWRGDPVLQFPLAGQPSSGAPAPSAPAPAVSAPAPVASAPAPAVSAPAPVASAPAPVVAAPPVPAASEEIDVPIDVEPLRVSDRPQIAAIPPTEPAVPMARASSAPTASSSPVAAPPAPVRAAPAAPAAVAVPASRPPSAPPPSGRRRAGEDLIGELFEAMHDLHFVSDMMAGVDFVLGIVNRILPSEGVMVHVFDINSRHFVVVRALGSSPQRVVLHRTPDNEALFRRAMRRTHCARSAHAEEDPSYQGGRWELLGVRPKTALLGPVQLGGRYLGAIELANPAGGEPYTDQEAHAIDYICEQLAEFLAARPIVLDADVVLGRS